MLYSEETTTADKRADAIKRIMENGLGVVSQIEGKMLSKGYDAYVFEHRNNRGEFIGFTGLMVRPVNR